MFEKNMGYILKCSYTRHTDQPNDPVVRLVELIYRQILRGCNLPVHGDI